MGRPAVVKQWAQGNRWWSVQRVFNPASAPPRRHLISRHRHLTASLPRFAISTPHRVVTSFRDIDTSPRRHPAVEGGFDGAPIRHVLREDGLKAWAVRRLDQVGELVQHHVFDGARRFRGEAAVKNDVARARAACPPLAFHGADADAGGADAEPLLPLRDERVEAALEFAALEAFEVPLDFGGIVWVAGLDDEAWWRFGGAPDSLGSDPAGSGPHLEHVHRTEEPVRLSCHVL